jgi:UDP-N-acetylmuramate dehydrogenase
VSDDLSVRLRAIEGLRLAAGELLSKHNTFRIGGPAELLGRVSTLAALTQTVAAVRGAGAPLQLLGLGSNVLIPDEGLSGLVLRLEAEFKEIEYREGSVWAGAAVSLGQLARRTAGQGQTGLEPLSGFPSTVGGAVVMNAGCYGTEIKDLLESTTVVEADGSVTRLTVEDLRPGYRSSALQGTERIVADAVFQLERGDPVAALRRIHDFNQKRRGTLPWGLPNVGSIFKNPEGDYAGRLIDECGLKGLEHGGARISPKHGNVIVNFESARAADVLELMVRARQAVAERFGVELEPEVVLTGSLRERWLAVR